MLIITLIQLAAAAFFPFCAALMGLYPLNRLSQAIYLGCLLVMVLARLANWIVARECGSLADLPEPDYLRVRKRIFRGAVFLSVIFGFTLVMIFGV
jgi:uncharacterized membrane protein